MRSEMLAYDRVQCELIRQVYIGCAERGALLERCRVQQHEWTVRLMLAIQELRVARDKGVRGEREALRLQEERLKEQMVVTRELQQKVRQF